MSHVDIKKLRAAVKESSGRREEGANVIEEVFKQIMSLHSPEDGERLTTLADELYNEAVQHLPHGTLSHNQAFQAGKIACLAMLIRFHQERGTR
jgi:hypothetical protein